MANASLAPVLLVSMPQMNDANFSKTVVLLAEYGAHGAFGLVLNRRMDEPAKAIITADDPLDIHPKMHLYTGGPVEPTRAWILTGHEELDPDALEVMPGVYLSASPTLVRRTLESRARSDSCAWWSAMPAGARGSSTQSSRRADGCSRRSSRT